MGYLQAYHFEHGENHGLVNTDSPLPITDEVTSVGALGGSGFSRRVVSGSGDDFLIGEPGGTYPLPATTYDLGVRFKTNTLNAGLAFVVVAPTVFSGNARALVAFNADGSLSYRSGTSTLAGSNSVLASSAVGVIKADTEHFLALRWNAADSGGTFDVSVDGTTVISYTGDTQPGSGSPLQWGWQIEIDTPSGGSSEVFLDDIVIAADLPAIMTPKRHVVLLPNGVTVDDDGVEFGGAATANEALDEIPATDVDGINLNAVNDRQGLTFTDFDAPSYGTINYVQAYSAIGDAALGSETVTPEHNDGTATTVGAALGMGASFDSTEIVPLDELSPSGGGWNDTKLDALSVTIERTA